MPLVPALDRLVDFLKGDLPLRACPQELFQSRPQFGERCPQIVRDCIGSVAHPVDQLLDLLQHRIDRLGEPVESIGRVARRDPL